MGWPTREQEFSQISDDALDIVVRNVLSLSPNSGERMVLGALRGRGLLVQRNRVRQSIFRVNPVSRALHRFRTVQRRVLQCNEAQCPMLREESTTIHMYNSLHVARKYATIFVHGHDLVREVNSCPRV